MPVLLTVNGTGVADPFGPGFAADLGRYLSDPWNDIAAQFVGSTAGNVVRWQPVGYPAAMFPMKPSIEAGRTEVNRLISLEPPGTPLILAGYSQGAIVTGEVWRDDILKPTGRHHNRLGDVAAIIAFGDPLRCPGVANGNDIAGKPAPRLNSMQVSGGIAGPGCLRPAETPDFVASCALDGDLYAAAPVGENPWTAQPLVGQIETEIYNFVLTADIARGLTIIAQRLAQTYAQPLVSIIAHIQAIVDGLTFAAAGLNAPHWRYGDFVAPIGEWVRRIVTAHQTLRAAS